MAALTPSFWSLGTHSVFQDLLTQVYPRPGTGVVADILKCVLLSVSTALLAGKWVSILRHLRQNRRQKRKKSEAAVYAVTSLVLFPLFFIGTILYCTKFFLALKEALCIGAIRDPSTGNVITSEWIHCRAVFTTNGAIDDKVDRVLNLVFALNAQVMLSIVNGILVYRCCKLFSDMRLVYVPIKAVYVLWIVISFVEMYTILRFDWDVPVHERLFKLTFNALMDLCFSLSFIFNFLVTAAIAVRRFLHLHGKASIPEGSSFPLDNKKRQCYNRAMILLVDAALPVTVCSFSVLISYFGNSNTSFFAQGILAVLWLCFSVLTPHLFALHHLRAEAKQCASETGMVAVDQLRDSESSLHMDIKTLTYSGIESTAEKA